MFCERTFLFIHGFGGSHRWWDLQVAYFQAYGNVVALDLPGHGMAAWHGETLDAMAARVDAALVQKGITGGVVSVASSFGGLVALTLGQRRPELFDGMVFAGSLPRFTAAPDFPAGLTPERIRKLSAQLEGDAGKVLEMFFRSLFTHAERSSGGYALIRRLGQEVPCPSKDALNGFLDILGMVDLREALGQVRVPVQFILGDEDYICPAAVLEPLKRLLPQAKVDVMEGCSHFPFLSRPDDFNILVKGVVPL